MNKYNRDEILRRIDDLEKEIGWFHYIDLGNGIKTKTQSQSGEPLKHPLKKWSYIKNYIPQDLSRMKILDIGCNAGFFSIEAKRRNAEYVLGIDASEGYVKQARFAADVLNLEIDFKRMSIYELPELKTSFDLVLCLGVIYHCKYPLLAAENVADICNKTAIIESALMNDRMFILQKRLRQIKQILTGKKNSQEEAIWQYVYKGSKKRQEDKFKLPEGGNCWYPNMTALVNLFKSAGFTEVKKNYQVDGRGSILCTK